MPRLLTKHFWDIHIGFMILVALGSVLEPPAAAVALVSLAYLGAALLIAGHCFLKHRDETPRRRRDPQESHER